MKIILIPFFFFVFQNIKGQMQSNEHFKSCNNNQIDNLKEYYDKAHGKDSIKFMKLFFLSFPDSYISFNSIYGYDDKSGPMPLYSISLEHIALFCRLNTVQSEIVYFTKLIKLGINGHWDADAVNFIQNCILSHVSENPDLAITILKQFKNTEIRSFWRFLFDGPHPEDKTVKQQFDTLHKNIELIDKKMANLMQIEYLRLIKDRVHNH